MLQLSYQIINTIISVSISGGFYSDDVGYVAQSCKKCPNGSFVAFDKAPGTQTSDCKSCPEGMLEGYYVQRGAIRDFDKMFKNCNGRISPQLRI